MNMAGEYQVAMVSSNDPFTKPQELLNALAGNVNQLTAEGWVPAGGVTYIPGVNMMACQAMFRAAPRLAIAN